MIASVYVTCQRGSKLTWSSPHLVCFYLLKSTIADPTMIPDSTFLDYITSEKLAFKRDYSDDPLGMYGTCYTMCFPPVTKSYMINSQDELMEFDYAPSNWGMSLKALAIARWSWRQWHWWQLVLCREMLMTCWNWPSGVRCSMYLFLTCWWHMTGYGQVSTPILMSSRAPNWSDAFMKDCSYLSKRVLQPASCATSL